jgi:hypothetical protein
LRRNIRLIIIAFSISVVIFNTLPADAMNEPIRYDEEEEEGKPMNRAGALCCGGLISIFFLTAVVVIVLFIFKGRDQGKVYVRELMRTGLSKDEMDDKWNPPGK